MSAPPSPITTQLNSNAELLQSAIKGFDYLFSNDIASARSHFAGKEDPFHILGQGVCAFLEAALGMEPALMLEASRCLALSETGTRKQMKAPKAKIHSRFSQGLEWEILNADAVVLLGLTHALSESYMGYLQCMYALNSAHSKFTKLYKTVFPAGIDQDTSFSSSFKTSHSGPASPLQHKPSFSSLSSQTSSSSSSVVSVESNATLPASPSAAATEAHMPIVVPAPVPAPATGFFSRWTSLAPISPASASEPALALHLHVQHKILPDGPVEDLIVAGTAFGFGLFNLVFSLLPKKVQSLVGFLGFKHDRKLALKALALSASKKDVHGVFAGLVLMTYHGVVLLLSGYQADEERIIQQYKSIVDDVESRYPEGALWILNRAKILRMSYDAEGAILVLQDGLRPERPHSFAQADMVLMFELAWTLLSQRRYEKAADAFIKITELNSWSHATYYFIAAGCYVSLGYQEKAQTLLDKIPDLIDKKKVGGKDLPTEVFIKKKLAFYKEKQLRRGGDEKDYIQAVKISPAEEIGIFWNNHARISKTIAEEHIAEWALLTPKPAIPSPFVIPATMGSSASLNTSFASLSIQSPTTPDSASQQYPMDDLDCPDDLAVRSLLLGITHRTAGCYATSRAFLMDAYSYQSTVKVSTWIGGVAIFELAVLDLKELEAAERSADTFEYNVNGDISRESSASEEPFSARPDGIEKKERDWREEWRQALKNASAKLEMALSLAPSSVDLSSRLDGRISMLRDEIALKREMMGIH